MSPSQSTAHTTSSLKPTAPRTRGAAAAVVLGLVAGLVPIAFVGTAFAQPNGHAAGQTPTLVVDPATALPPDAPRDVSKYDLKKGKPAIGGYDPVAYFPEGDEKDGKGHAVKGSDKLAFTYRGVTYHFSSQKNLDLFKANPLRYEPAYGGWCAYACAKDKYTKPDPKNFRIQDNRLMLFYKDAFTDTNKLWDKEGPTALTPPADVFWQREAAEPPRGVPART